ncbi:FadR/GntR family transcriptional regulator [Maritimibacter sp. 55A14]|uniref:FadR/GntR family transcriptional regulator n=1 Tax=Maritimibacter sp. 55A14 TaxID=2174844 RepID=UPI001E2C3428|nr:FCD domain-containing protein [Maritimibacter sp. 55A14]
MATELRRSIESGEFQRFERLPPSRTLAENLGVARNTLRAALIQLEKEGLLETRPRSGTYVTSPDQEVVVLTAVEEATPLELIDARFALEPHICRLCVLHARREDFELLDSLCSKMETAICDPVTFAGADTTFHRALALATRNDLLIWLISQINIIQSLDKWTRMRHLTLDEQIIRQYNKQHRETLNALRSREPERAAVKMKEHLETARISLMRAEEDSVANRMMA